MVRGLLTVSVLVLVVACAVAPASAKWVAFDRTGDRLPSLKASGQLERFSVDLTLPGIELGEQEGYVTVRIPGHAASMVKGNPELPMITTSILLPDRGVPEVRLTALEEEVVKLTAKVIPSRGHVKRNIPLESVPLIEGDVYKQGALYPAEFEARVSDPYICRDARGAAVRLNPVRYNPATGELRIMKKVRLEINVVEGLVPVNDKTRISDAIDSDFAPIYARTFINWAAFTQSKGTPTENSGHALILCPDKWTKNLAPLTEWRQLKGLETTVVPVSQITGTAEAPLTAAQIKAFLQADYDKGGLTWVLLVGDGDTMPTLKGENEQADSDACLVKLEGADHVPDAFISRFSAKTDADVDLQVARAVAYEKAPVVGEAAAFYRKAIGIASDQGSPTDKERSEWLRTALEGAGYTTVDKIYDPGASKAKVAEAANAGRGLINYIGHGSKTMWVTSGFGVTNAAALTNGGGKWPMIWSVACVNGDFVAGSDCFAEAWAKAGSAADPKGAIGMVAASTNMSWVPPCDWQNAICTKIALPKVAFTGGAQHYLGLLKAMEQWGTETSSEGVMLVEQCIFFGDSSVVLRNDVPLTATVAVDAVANRGLTLKVLAGDKPVKGARVVVASELQGAITGVTGEDGTMPLAITAGAEQPKTVSVTVTGPNLIPVIQQELALPEPPAPPAPPADPPR